MLHRIRTSIRRERRALAALGGISIAVAVVIGAAEAGGDQRRLGVVAVFPADGDEVPVVIDEISVTFDRPVDRGATESALRIVPPLEGTVAWQGNTLRFRLSGQPEPGQYRVELEAGELGRRGEPWDGGLITVFSVRAPGVLLVRQVGATESAVSAIRDGREREVVRTGRASGIVVSPDGAFVAISRVDGPCLTTAVADVERGIIVREHGSEEVNISVTAWGPSLLLVVARSEQITPGDYGAGRLWLMRIDGEFVAEVDPSGEPTLGAAWSPDGQWLLYVAPASAELRLQNMATGEVRVAGVPRGVNATWSPDSRLFAFESAAETTAAGLRQPVRVVGVGGAIDRVLGEPGEVRIQPTFVDERMVATGRLLLGQPESLAIVVESVETGAPVQTIALGRRGFIASMEKHPTANALLVVTREAGAGTVLMVDLDSGSFEVIGEGVSHAAWLP